MILVDAVVIASVLAGVGPDSVSTARRVAASAELAAQEYRIGVPAQIVVAPAEVEEATLFLGEARRTAELLPESVSASAVREIERALLFVASIGPADSLDASVARLTALLTTSLGVSLVDIPGEPPSLRRGRALYQRECSGCHGGRGAGDGPAGRVLDPAPSDLTDRVALSDVTPLAFYQRITIGVAGTAMPGYETRLDAADRWALALYSTTLRQAEPAGEVPPELQSFSMTAELNDQQVLDALGPAADLQALAAVRMYQSSGRSVETAIFASVRAKVAEAHRLAAQGDHDAAVAAAFDAYLAFEAVERTVRVKQPALATELEASFAALRNRVAGGATASELESVEGELLAGLERAERVVGDGLSPFNIFLQSLVIMIREGLEAILIIGALITFLVKIGAGHRRRDIHIGVGAAVALSVLTAVLLETVFQLSPANQEVLEGITMLAAVGVLFYVSYWLLSKMEVDRWTSFVKERVQVAVSGGSAFALASAAFLAVYREGFETVLFYKALVVSGGGAGGTFLPVLGGIGVGGLALAAVYIAINRYGVRLPLKPFFAVTSAFLYYTAFVFAGKGIGELQAGGVIGTTILQGWPRLPVLGVYPTVESMVAQAVLAFFAMVAVAWILISGRRERVAIPAPAAMALPDPLLGHADGPGMEGAVLRSLEQMDADLSALKDEVERIRDTVVEEAVNRDS